MLNCCLIIPSTALWKLLIIMVIMSAVGEGDGDIGDDDTLLHVTDALGVVAFDLEAEEGIWVGGGS